MEGHVSRKILEHVLGPVEVSILTKEEARAVSAHQASAGS